MIVSDHVYPVRTIKPSCVAPTLRLCQAIHEVVRSVLYPFLEMVCDIDGIDTLIRQASYCSRPCSDSPSAIVCRNRGHVHLFPHRVIIHPNKCSRRPVPPPAAAPTAMTSTWWMASTWIVWSWMRWPWMKCPWWSFVSCSWYVATVNNKSALLERWWLYFTVRVDGLFIFCSPALSSRKGVRWISRSSYKAATLVWMHLGGHFRRSSPFNSHHVHR